VLIHTASFYAFNLSLVHFDKFLSSDHFFLSPGNFHFLDHSFLLYSFVHFYHSNNIIILYAYTPAIDIINFDALFGAFFIPVDPAKLVTLFAEIKCRSFWKGQLQNCVFDLDTRPLNNLEIIAANALIQTLWILEETSRFGALYLCHIFSLLFDAVPFDYFVMISLDTLA